MLAYAEQLLQLPPPFNMIMLVMLIIFGAWMACHIAEQVRRYASQRAELEFKRDLVARGVEVDEIERIVRAGGEQGVDDKSA